MKTPDENTGTPRYSPVAEPRRTRPARRTCLRPVACLLAPHRSPTGIGGRQAGRRVRGAFTYVELLMVMVILAIVALAAKPRVVEVVQRERLRRAAHKLRLDMKLLQSEALKNRAPTALGIDPGREFYVLWWYKNSSLKWRFLNAYEPRVPSIFSLGMEPDYRVAIDTVTDNVPNLTFDAYGLPRRNLIITLALGTLRADVRVNAASGAIESGDVYDAGVFVRSNAISWPTKTDAKLTAPGPTED